MNIRNFNKETDWSFFEHAENESYMATNKGEPISKELLEQRRSDLIKFIENDDFFVKVIYEKNAICGIIIAGVQKNGDVNLGCIYNIYISPNHRRNGYGTLAMKKATEFCKTKDCKKVLLNVGAENIKAISLYRNLGFYEKNLTMELPIRK